jgi:hypothetical protein
MRQLSSSREKIATLHGLHGLLIYSMQDLMNSNDSHKKRAYHKSFCRELADSKKNSRSQRVSSHFQPILFVIFQKNQHRLDIRQEDFFR